MRKDKNNWLMIRLPIAVALLVTSVLYIGFFCVRYVCHIMRLEMAFYYMLVIYGFIVLLHDHVLLVRYVQRKAVILFEVLLLLGIVTRLYVFLE